MWQVAADRLQPVAAPLIAASPALPLASGLLQSQGSWRRCVHAESECRVGLAGTDQRLDRLHKAAWLAPPGPQSRPSGPLLPLPCWCPPSPSGLVRMSGHAAGCACMAPFQISAIACALPGIARAASALPPPPPQKAPPQAKTHAFDTRKLMCLLAS